MKVPEIDWALLAEAAWYYRTTGYQEVPTPWVVEKEAVLATIPRWAKASCIQPEGVYPVGSAEQGFIQLLREGHTVPKAFSISPCFRLTDDERGEYHYGYFMKLELFAPGCDPGALRTMREDARRFMQSKTLKPVIKAITSETREFEGCDLEVDGVEVGSYGFRRAPFPLTFGTGLALPRFSMLR